MGRVKEHNRKISNDRVKKERKQKNKTLIAVEGNNKTEKLYFTRPVKIYKRLWTNIFLITICSTKMPKIRVLQKTSIF